MNSRTVTLLKFGFALALASLSTLFIASCSGATARTKVDPDSKSQTIEQGSAADSLVPNEFSRATLLDSGVVFFKRCAICHGGNGRGGRGPNLANSDYVQGGRERLIRTILGGVRDSIRVNGVRWKTGEMLGWADTYNDFKIAAVLTYIRVVLNDSIVASCIPEDIETGTWASCTMRARDPSDIATDSISVREVATMRAAMRR